MLLHFYLTMPVWWLIFACPNKSVYAASKIYIKNFSRALREELKPFDISVSTLQPGATPTTELVRNQIETGGRLAKLSVTNPRLVAEDAINKTLSKKKYIVPGWQNRLIIFILKLLPTSVKIKLVLHSYRTMLKSLHIHENPPTGGTGLLGRNIIECLLEGNHEVTLLLRDPQNKKQDKKITKVKGDVKYGVHFESYWKCEYVIHAAADTSQHHLNISDFKVNIQGTKNIVLACKKKNIKKLIHVGSAGFFGYGTKENSGDENAIIKYPSNQSLYLMSKLHAQQEINAYSKTNSVITIHPTFMIGALDYGPSSGK